MSKRTVATKLRRASGWSLAILVTGVGGCSFETLEPDETDVVLTVREEGRDYSELATYALPDRVVDICEALEGDPRIGGLGGAGGAPSFEIDSEDCRDVEHTYDDVVLEALERNMDDLGYRRIEDPTERPDVVLFVGYIAQDNFFIGSSWGWCDPYFYYAGCWAPSYTYVYNLPTGTLLVDMVVVDESEDGELTSAWTFSAQGLLTSAGDLSPEERIERAIDQGFEQSPYLAEGGAE